MDYLTLCQKVCLEVDIAGGESAITTVQGQTGELARVVEWVKNSWIELQNRNNSNWRWMKQEFSIQTVDGQDSYAYNDPAVTNITTATPVPFTRFARWSINDRRDPPRIYLTASGVGGEGWMVASSWDLFRQIYQRGAQNSGYSRYITIDPQNNLFLGPKPDDIYTVSGYLVHGPQILANDTDTPDMPSNFHQLLVYMVMEKYGMSETASEVVARAQTEGRRMLRQLENNQLTKMRKRGPLA